MGLIVDNFAGGGGASTGIEAAIGRAVDYAINHDEQAIRMHEANHPGTVTVRDRFAVVTVTIDDATYVIVDIGMRMLTPRELFNAQGFPPDYIIDQDAQGRPITKTAQVAKCGNSVCPPLAEALVRANLAEVKQAESEAA